MRTNASDAAFSRMVLMAIITAVIGFVFCGCEQRVNSDGKAWLADREEYRPAPQTDHVMADLQATLDAGPLAGWSQ